MKRRTSSTTTTVATGDLLTGVEAPLPATERLADGAVLLRGFALAEADALMAAIRAVTEDAPFRHMTTPGGFRMSAAMSSCGALGWITDRRGYRYSHVDPDSGRPWPAMPALLLGLAGRAAAAAGFAGFVPDSCLINRYEPDAKLSLHQDRDERDHGHPIVSVSLGVPAIFLFGGLVRKDRPSRYRLLSGDIVVWGGPTRLAFHGVEKIEPGEHPLTGPYRYNLTFRRAG